MFTSTPEWANVTKILPVNTGNRTDYRWYANDSAGNVNNTEVFNVITTAAPDTNLSQHSQLFQQIKVYFI